MFWQAAPALDPSPFGQRRQPPPALQSVRDYQATVKKDMFQSHLFSILHHPFGMCVVDGEEWLLCYLVCIYDVHIGQCPASGLKHSINPYSTHPGRRQGCFPSESPLQSPSVSSGPPSRHTILSSTRLTSFGNHRNPTPTR
ncbi:unnamed protein product [Periconia digitata]|uniref:Uncharacterized protein n=1 Tax=Periconia digitata TaxID=1303443 RepID=A0A9W4U5M9_9PLEO|nr:unnamed protein product [Periconia digitata]